VTEGKKAAEGSSLSSDVFSPSVRTAIGQFILMKSIFRLKKKFAQTFGSVKEIPYLCPIKSTNPTK
jgi:hypothetical protein